MRLARHISFFHDHAVLGLVPRGRPLIGIGSGQIKPPKAHSCPVIVFICAFGRVVKKLAFKIAWFWHIVRLGFIEIRLRGYPVIGDSSLAGAAIAGTILVFFLVFRIHSSRNGVETKVVDLMLVAMPLLHRM